MVATLLTILGLVFGSFIATVAIRWPEGRSPLEGRSRCDSCEHILAAIDLVPLVSFIARRGRCGYCGARIDRFHPIVEASGGAIGLATGLMTTGWPAIAGVIFGWLLLLLAALDWRAFWLPNQVTGALALAGLATGVAGLSPGLPSRLIGGIAGYLALRLIAAGYRITRGREGLGGGDAKLLGAIGLWLGWRTLPFLVLLACLIGFAIIALRLAAGRRVAPTDRLPLGMLLALAAFPLWLVHLPAR